MKRPDETQPGDHPKDLLFHYLEGELDPGESANVKRHLDACSECLKEFRMLDETVSMLRVNREAFCPEAWEVYEFVKTGSDPEGSLTRHVSGCPTCSQEAEAYRTSVHSSALPEAIKEKVEKRFSKNVTDFRSPEPRLTSSGWFSSSIKRRIVVCGALAASIALVVLMYPRGAVGPRIGLSPTIWEQTEHYLTPKAGPLGPPKTNLAVLFVFREFPGPVPQADIDSLYQAVKPGPELSERFQFIQPVQVRDALGGARLGSDNREALYKVLRDKVYLQRLLLLTVSPKGTAFRIEGELIDLTSGQILKSQSGQVAGKSQLMSTIGEWLSLME